MGNKKKRNKLCECGSGKLFKNCHMQGAKPVAEKAEIPEKRIEHTISPAEANTMSDIMRVFQESQQEDHNKGDEILTKLIDKEIKVPNRFSALITIGAISLLPDNQAMEQRLLQLGQKVVGSSNLTTTIQTIDLKKILKTFDKHFGSTHEMAEIDTKAQIYISWIKFEDQYHRIFTGTLAEGEIYLRDLIWKYEAVRQILSSDLKTAHELLCWAFVKVDDFIEASGLIKYESSSGADNPNTNIYVDDRVTQLTAHLSSSFIVIKDELPRNISVALSKVSRANTDYSDGGMTDFYSYPVVDYGSHYVIPFPQLLIPAILKWVFGEIPKQKNKVAINDKFEQEVNNKVAKTLKSFFGEKSVMSRLELDHKIWADFCVRYDGKLIFLSTATCLAGEDLSEKATINTKHVFELRDEYIKNEALLVQSQQGTPRDFAGIITLFEPLVITLVDKLDEDLLVGIGDIGETALHDVIPVSSFYYIIAHSKSPLDFVRYLRAVDDLRRRKIRMPGATPIDLFAMYKEGNHQLREAEEDPNMLLIDLTSGARIITESTREKRKDAGLISLDGKKSFLRKHYDNFYGNISGDNMMLYRVDVTPTIEIKIPLLRREKTEEIRHSIYIVFDSLCYFLDQKHPLLKEELSGRIDDIRITVINAPDQKEAIKMESVLNQQNCVEIVISVSEKAHELFIGDNNAGEREIIKHFAEAVNISDTKTWVDKVIPLSKDRNFQTNIYSLSHKSYENAPQPMRIEEGDRWWVDEVLSKAILADGVNPGSYTDPEDIGKLATRIASISRQEVIARLNKYPRQQLIERAYTELEAVYAWDERKDYETLASIAIRGHDEVIKKHTQHNQDSTQLSFAYRYLIEAALQSDTEGDELLTDEAFLEILALAERYVDVEFWGDTTFLGLQPGRLYISKRGFPGIESTGNGRILSEKRVAAGLKSTKYRSDLQKKLMKEGAPKAGDKENALYSKLNTPFKQEFEYTLEEFVDTSKAIIDLFSNSTSPIVMISKTVLRDKLSSDIGLDKSTIEKIINHLTLSSEVIKEVDINPSQRFWREVKLLNKPLVAMPLNKNILLLTRAVMERSLLSFLDRLMAGRLEYLKKHQQSDLNKAVMDIVNDAARDFEDAVCNAAESVGLVVRRRCTSIGGTGIPKEGVGEIDGIAWNAKSKTLYVLEIKDSTPSRSPIEIKSEMDNYFGRDGKKSYFGQLEKKYEWIKEHPDLIRKEFSIDNKVKLTVKPLLVSDAIVASAILRTPPLPILTLDEFIDSQ